MQAFYHVLYGVVLPIVVIGGLLFVFWRALKKSAAPVALLIRWGLTVVLLFWLVSVGQGFEKAYRSGDRSAAMAPGQAAVIGVLLAAIWVPSLTGFFGTMFGSLFDGGSVQVDPKPFYSIFNKKKSTGKYLEALAEVRRQLDKFPNDYEGQILLAELQAENLADLQGAELTVQRCCAQVGRSEGEIASALNRLADWHMLIGLDREAAQKTLERIMELFPNTDRANRAAQRIAHLAKQDQLVQPHDRQRMELKKGIENLGLTRGANGRLKVPEVDRSKLADEYVEHLTEHPMDTEAREKLAVIYAQHFHRLDLAMEQLELLVQIPGATSKQIVHWLNVCVDLQVGEKDDEQNIRSTLQRIVDAFPGQPSAENAQRRLDRLKLELKATSTVRTMKVGDYEKDIGLKRKT